MAPEDLHAATRKVWERGWKPAGEAFHTKEFHRLVRTCERLYPGMQPRGEHTPYQEAVENVFLNAPSRWSGNIEQSPAQAAEVIHSAFTQSRWPLTLLVPLDGCPTFPGGRVKFGKAEVGPLSQKELGALIREIRWRARFSRLWKHESERESRRLEEEIGKLSRFQWLAVRTEHDEPDLTKRVVADRLARPDLRSADDDGSDIEKAHPHTQAHPTDLLQALFALALCAWEDIVDFGIAADWRPFQCPWCYPVSDDPLARLPHFPSADSLSWETVDFGASEEALVPVRARHDPEGMNRVGTDLARLWKLTSGVWPSSGDSHPAFSDLVPHFFLQAFDSGGIDQLLYHLVAIDAVLGKEERGATDAAARRVDKLVPGSEQVFRDLYDLRRDFIHGRKLRRDLWNRDLVKARKMTRQVLEGWLRCLGDHPGASRDDLLSALQT